jgi:hypothetical protein
MNERLVDSERAIVAHHESPEVAKPGDAALDDPALLVTPQQAPVLRRRPATVRAVRSNQGHTATPQPFAQRVAVVALVGNYPRGFLPGASALVPPPDSDRLKRFFREPDFRRGSRVKSDSQRNTAAVDHHHPLRSLARLGLSHSGASFFAGAKLPSRNDSLHFNCCCSFNSARNARQILSQTPCSSHSRSRRQQVAGDGNSSGKSCHTAPLRRIHPAMRDLPTLCGQEPEADRHAVAAVVGEARAGSSPIGRRSATDRIGPSALLLALIPNPIHLHRKITIPNSTHGPGF